MEPSSAFFTDWVEKGEIRELNGGKGGVKNTFGGGGCVKQPWASLVAQLVKNPPAEREPRVQSLGWKDPLEKGKATHSSILAWRIPWTA